VASGAAPERLELRYSARTWLLTAGLGVALCVAAAIVPRGDGAAPVNLAVFGLLFLGAAAAVAIRGRRPVVILDRDGLRDERLRESLIPWSVLDVAYYHSAERSIRLRFLPGRSHPVEPARAGTAWLGLLVPALRHVTPHAFHEGELCVPLGSLGAETGALRRLLATRTRPYEKTPYAAEVAADARAAR
jgi:hypothetical protein